MTTILTLGGILFTNFEVPEKINWGGKQMLTSHKLIGGQRRIDAMGPDDDNITWSGRFRGAGAEIRARQLNLLRRQGKPQPLSWSTQRFSVIIEEFKADFQQSYEIPYTISVMVIEDLTSPLLNALIGLDTAIGADLNGILQIGAGLNLPGISTAVGFISKATGAITGAESFVASGISAVSGIGSTLQSFGSMATSAVSGVQSAISGLGSAVSTVQSFATSAVDGVQSALTSVETATSSAISSLSNAISNGIDVTAGVSPSTVASNLSAGAASFSALGQLTQVAASAGRMATNLTNRAA